MLLFKFVVVNTMAFVRMICELFLIFFYYVLIYLLQHSCAGSNIAGFRPKTNEQTAISRPWFVWLSVCLSLC